MYKWVNEWPWNCVQIGCPDLSTPREPLTSTPHAQHGSTPIFATPNTMLICLMARPDAAEFRSLPGRCVPGEWAQQMHSCNCC